jgi:hypothetical protein
MPRGPLEAEETAASTGGDHDAFFALSHHIMQLLGPSGLFLIQKKKMLTDTLLLT